MGRTPLKKSPSHHEAGFLETNQAVYDSFVAVGGNELLRQRHSRLGVDAPQAGALSGDLDSGTEVAAEHVKAFQEADPLRVGAAKRPHGEAGARIACEATGQEGTVF